MKYKKLSITVLCLVLLFIGYVLGRGAKTYEIQKLGNPDPMQNNSKNFSVDRKTKILPNIKDPKIDIKVVNLRNGNFNLDILSQNFNFTPNSYGGKAIQNSGFASVIINGKLVSHAYQPRVFVQSENFIEGVNLIEIYLNANDGTFWTNKDNSPLKYSFEIKVRKN